MLDPSADEIRAWGNSVVELMIDYLSGVGGRKIYGDFSSREIRDQLDDALPTNGGDFDNLLKAFRETIIPFSRQNAHPRMFGYVQSPGTPLAAFADLLASTLNANLTAWRSAPAPVELERLTIDWIRQILGFDSGAGGLFVSGGSMANFAALAAARKTKSESSSRLRIYASSETHFSIAKAAALLGVGRENVRGVAVDESFRIRTEDLVAQITTDRKSGHIPFCVIANAGTVNTAQSIPWQRFGKLPTASSFGCMWMGVMAPLPSSRSRRVTCSPASSRLIQLRSILISGSISRWTLAA